MNTGRDHEGLPAGGAELVGSFHSSTRYEKIKDIKGSLYGMVYLALDTRTNRKVVIKSSNRRLALSKTLPDGKPSKEDLLEEIRIHTKLSNDPEPCPYIIKLLDVVWTRDTIDLVLEYVSGGELYSVTEDKMKQLNQELDELRGSPEYDQVLHKHWEEVVKLMKQILQATAYLHARNISHRDLSLENILLDGNGNIRLIDFGNAREYRDTNWLSERGRIGKPGYWSPECYARDFYDGRDNDMWCNGVNLWKLLVGAEMWKEPDPYDIRFNTVYFQGLQGLEKLVAHNKLTDRLPPYCRDFIVKIFCPQKCRLTIKEALEHPFVTSATPSDDFCLRRVPVQTSMQPDELLNQLAHRTRYETVDIPHSWVVLDPEQRQKIINRLVRVSKNGRSTVLDRSVVLDVAKETKLDRSDARAIIHYLWASSQHPSQVEFIDHTVTEGNFNVNARRESKEDVRRRGCDVDNEDEKCDLNFQFNSDVRTSTPYDERIPEIRRGYRRDRSSVKVDRHKRVRSPRSSTRKTQSTLGGFLMRSSVTKSTGSAQEKPLVRRRRRSKRWKSAGHSANLKLLEQLVEGDEPRTARTPRGVHRNSHINRFVHQHAEDHIGVTRNREKKINRPNKVRKSSRKDDILTCTALADV